MKDSQHISKYLVWFNSLAVHCPWGEAALRYRFYEGLPARLKDEICWGDGKPDTLSGLQTKAQNIDAQHWEQTLCPSNQQKPQNSNSASNNNSSNSSKPAPSNSGNNSQSSGSKSRKSKETPKPQSTKLDLMGKLDSNRKLTQQERQCRIDNNLCLFCGKPGHKVPDCPTKASSAKGWAATSTTTTTPAQGKDSSELKKQWAIHYFQHRRWIAWRPPVLRRLPFYVQLNLQFLIPFLFMFPFRIFLTFLLILFLIVVLLIVSSMNILLILIIFLSLLFLQWSSSFLMGP